MNTEIISNLSLNKKTFLMLFFIMFTIFVFTADGHRHSPDEGIAYDEATRIFEQKPHPDYVQDESHYGFDYPALKAPWSQPICYNGILCSNVPIGYSITLVPFIAINDFLQIISEDTVTWSEEDFPTTHYIFWRNSLEPNFVFLDLFYSPFFSSLTVGVFYLFCRLLNYSQKTSITLSLLFAFSTILWAYSQTSLNSVPATFFTFLGFFFCILYTKNSQIKYILFCGLSIGFAYIIRMDAILFIVPIIILLVIQLKNNRKKFLSIFYFIIPLISFLAIQKLIDIVRFGLSFVSTNSQAIIQIEISEIPNLLGHNYPLFIGGFGMLLSPGVGLLVFSPILFLIFLSLPDFYKNHKKECLMIISIVSLFLIFYGTLDRWHGLVGWSERYLLTIIPLLMLPIGASIEKWKNISFKMILICLGAVGIFFNLVYLFQDVIWFIWGEPGVNGLYAVDSIDGIRNDLNIDPSVIWSFKHSQLTHTIISFFNFKYIDIYLVKAFDYPIYFISLIMLLFYPVLFLTKSFKSNNNEISK